MIAGIDPRMHTQGVAFFVGKTLTLVAEKSGSLENWGLFAEPRRARMAMASAGLALVSENVHALGADERAGLEDLVRLAHVLAKVAWDNPRCWSALRMPGNPLRELKEFRQSLSSLAGSRERSAVLAA